MQPSGTGVHTWADRLGFRNHSHMVVLGLIYVVFFLTGLHLIADGGYFGQDFDYHRKLTARLLANPVGFSYLGSADPPLLYAIGAVFLLVFGDGTWAATSVILLCLNVASLHLCYLIAKRICRSDAVLFMGMSFLAWLPLTVITSVVFASDALTPAPFFGFVYCLVRILEARDRAEFWRYCWFALATMLFAAVAKYTLVVLAPASVLLFVAVFLYRRPQRADAAFFFVSVVLVPSLALASVAVANPRHKLFSTTFPHLSPALTLSTLLVPKPQDVYVLSAPNYWEPITEGGKQITIDRDGTPSADGSLGYELLVNNRYSYPALLHLAIHTNILNVGAGGMRSNRDVPPSSFLHAVQVASVNLGVLFSLLGLAAACYAIYRVAWFFRADAGERLRLLVVAFLLVPTLGSYLAVVVMLPFLVDPYYGGYWLPRLVFPAILGFGILTLFLCDDLRARLALRSPRLSAIAGGALIGCAALGNVIHLLLLWL
jgi:hypothetical protein